jgi:hypothetical protein
MNMYGTFSVTDYVQGLGNDMFPGQSLLYWAAWLLPDGTIQAVVNHNDYRSTTGLHTGSYGGVIDGCVRLSLGRDTKDCVGGLGVEIHNTLTASQRRAVLDLTQQWDYDEVIADVYGDYGTYLGNGTFAGTRGLNNFLLQFEDSQLIAA